MMGLRSEDWETRVGWKGEDKDRIFNSADVLHEDLQYQTIPMVIVGSDVVNLYPNLDINKVVDTVQLAIMESSIQFDEIDYLEAARYVALNWTAEECRASPLGRILPTRRGTRGTRPGLRGTGAMEGETGGPRTVGIPTCETDQS